MNYLLLLRLTAQCARAQNGSQITRMRRILSFHGFFLILRFTWSWIYFGFYLRLYGADCPLHKKSVYSPQCNKNPYKSMRHKGAIPKIKNQWRTDPSHPLYPWLILNAASEPKACEHCNKKRVKIYCVFIDFIVFIRKK